MKETTIAFQRLEENKFEELDNCKGNACGSLWLRANFRNGENTIISVSANNSGDKSINISITWGNYLGGCGTGSSDVIFPHETIEIFTNSPAIIGYCSIRANFQTKEKEKLNLEGTQCEYGDDTFNDGETTCINDTDHKCRNGRWIRLGTREYCK